MSTDTSFRALRAANPRHQPGFDDWIDRLDVLTTQITATPVPALLGRRPRLNVRRRAIGLSVAAALAAAGVVGLTATTTSTPSAYAAAKKALVATTAASSGTITGTVRHDGSSYSLDTTQWNGNSIAVTRGGKSEFGPGQALTLIDGAAYVEQADGTWLRYSSESGVGPKLGPMVQLAHDNVAGNAADQVLSLATGLTQSSEPDGTTVYTGTIPETNSDPASSGTDDTILRIINNLRGGNDAIGPHKYFAPAGSHNGLQLQMTVGPDGLVRQISLTYQQQNTGSPQDDGTYTWTVTYSQLGSTRPITPPATSTATPPVVWSPGAACTAPCGG
jgi:hypothetical protein